jgi:2,4-dienoyl-CoA reductase-like NADH-dependent reductase (Old Yellow Enzyme family)
MTDVCSAIKLGNLQLPRRLAMAPMTRSWAQADGTPSDLAPEY